MKTCAAFLALFATVLSAADLPPPRTEKFQAGPWEDEYGYRAAVRVGHTLHVSGVTSSGPMPEAVQRAYTTLGKILARHGLNFSHVVKETVFTTDLDALKAAKDVRNPFYRGDYPAASWIGIARLFDPSHVIEVEVTAVFPDDAPAAAATQVEIAALLTEFLLKNPDPAQHDRFWADDLVYTSSAAKVQGKADILRSMRETAAQESAEPRPAYGAEDIVVRAYGSMAALNFRLVARNPDGTTSHYRNSGTFLHRNGRWQAVTWQATREPEPKG